MDEELELELEGKEDGHVKAPEEKTPDTTDGEPELQVEIEENDPLYSPDWKKDPAKSADDPNDTDYGPRVQKRISKLRASLSEAAKQRDRNMRERDEAVNLTRAYMGKIAELERQLVNGSAQYMERQADTEDAAAQLAERTLEQALQLGDPKAIARANSDLAVARAKSTQLRTAAEFRKSQIQASTPNQQQVMPVQQQPPPARVDPELAKFQERNPWFNRDGEMTTAAFEVHDDLAIRGVRVGSPGYYKAIEDRMKDQFPSYFGTPKKTPSSPVSQSTRSTPSQQDNGGTTNRVKLTASQVATAKRLGLTPLQYAQTLVKLRQEGVSV